jgi:hypothetical protein
LKELWMPPPLLFTELPLTVPSFKVSVPEFRVMPPPTSLPEFPSLNGQSGDCHCLD